MRVYILIFGILLCAINAHDNCAADRLPKHVVAHAVIPETGPIKIPVTIDGKEYRFAVDTGSCDTIINAPGQSPKETADGYIFPTRLISAFLLQGGRCDWIKDVVMHDLRGSDKTPLSYGMKFAPGSICMDSSLRRMDHGESTNAGGVL